MVTYFLVPTDSLDALSALHVMQLIRSGSRTLLGVLAANASLQEYYDHFMQRSSFIVLAKEGSRIVGTASLKFLSQTSSRALFRRSSLFYVWLLQNCPNVIELGYVVVAPDYAGKHIATTMCNMLLDYIPTKDMYSTVHTTNNSSIHLVNNLGFFPVGASYVSRYTGLPIQAYKHNCS